jgi:hypothetical protein
MAYLLIVYVCVCVCVCVCVRRNTVFADVVSEDGSKHVEVVNGVNKVITCVIFKRRIWMLLNNERNFVRGSVARINMVTHYL